MAPFIVIATVCLMPPLSPLGALPHPGIVGWYAPRRKAERQFSKRIDADCAAAARIWEEREANRRKKESAITTRATVGFISWPNGCDHRGENATRGRARGRVPTLQPWGTAAAKTAPTMPKDGTPAEPIQGSVC